MTLPPDTTPTGPAFALDRYVLTGRIATGGMATVYRARIQAAGVTREFAVKVLHPHLADAENVRGRFVDEARIASRIDHPNVVSTIDVGSCRGYQYLVLELIHGVTLRQLQLHRPHCPRLLSTDAARIIADAARGLHAVHSACDENGKRLHVVHRDVSPHNLMLDTRGRTVLIDLGLSKSIDQECHTQTGVLCGKLPYMSPEQSLLQALDARSDIFSLGSVLFELCTGELPFGEAHAAETLEALRTCDHEQLRRRLQTCSVPEWIIDVILRCLARDPADRFGTAIELAETLEAELKAGTIEHIDLRRRLAALALEAKLGDREANDSASHDVRPLPCIALPIPGANHSADPATWPSQPARRPSPVAAAPARAPRSVRTRLATIVRHPEHWIDSGRWVALGAALALVTVSGARLLRSSEASTDADDRPLAAGLAADTATPQRTAPAESLVPEPETPLEEVGQPYDALSDGSTGDSATDAEAETETARAATSKRQRRRVLHRRSKAARKLRGNPYQE